MPTYVYKFVETGETIEVQQSFTDATLTEYVHPDTGDLLAVKKVFQPVGVTFKGSGFFKNDNRGKTSTTTPPASTDATSDSSSSSASPSSSSDSSGSKDSTSPKDSSAKKDNSSTKKDSSSSKSSSSTS